MISAANILVDVHHIFLDQEKIDKMIFLYISKRLIERVRGKEAFAFIMLHNVLPNNHVSTNEEWNYWIVICNFFYHFHHIELNCSMKFFVLFNVVLIYSFYLMFVFKFIYFTLFCTVKILNPVNVIPNVPEHALQNIFLRILGTCVSKDSYFEGLGHVQFKWFLFLIISGTRSSNDFYFWGTRARAVQMISIFEELGLAQFKKHLGHMCAW